MRSSAIQEAPTAEYDYRVTSGWSIAGGTNTLANAEHHVWIQLDHTGGSFGKMPSRDYCKKAKLSKFWRAIEWRIISAAVWVWRYEAIERAGPGVQIGCLNFTRFLYAPLIRVSWSRRRTTGITVGFVDPHVQHTSPWSTLAGDRQVLGSWTNRGPMMCGIVHAKYPRPVLQALCWDWGVVSKPRSVSSPWSILVEFRAIISALHTRIAHMLGFLR